MECVNKTAKTASGQRIPQQKALLDKGMRFSYNYKKMHMEM